MKSRQKRMMTNMLALLVLLVLTGAYYFFSVLPREKARQSEGKVFLFPHLAKENINGLSIFYNNGSNSTQTELEYLSGRWSITKPRPYPANEEVVSRIINDLGGIKSERILTNIGTDGIREYGFDNPSKKLEIKYSGSNKIGIIIGSKTPAGDLSYVIFSTNSNTVFLVYDYKFSGIEKTAGEFKNTEIFTLPLQAVEGILIIERNKALYQYRIRTKDDEKWLMLKPRKREIGSYALKEKIMNLYGLTVQSFYEDEFNQVYLKKYGLDKPSYFIRIDSGELTNSLLIGNETANGIYAAFIPEKKQIIFIDGSGLKEKLNFDLTN